MNPSSPDAPESTRKIGAQIQAVILQRLADVTQEHAAACMGVSPSTVSRAVTDDLERICQILAVIGLQVSATDSMVVEPEEMRALKRMALKYLQADLAQDDHGAAHG
ncbi:MAG TPA: CII family transcriptional regulator [Castellaniella sp.]|uniref:CII family transcriptional regulator n=1 Tax=Castellaniella sp. TaxID=1955812 RepID=UPI002F24E73C